MGDDIKKIIPVSLLTGFLGSGKTTLLQRLLRADTGLRLGIVVNDFGSINIDADLIQEVHGDTQSVRLTNGCICCTVRGDLLETVVQLCSQVDAPDWIIVECSGVSDPRQVSATFTLTELTFITRLDAVIGVVDVSGFLNLPDEVQDLANAQVEAAHLILLNKTDLVPESQIRDVESAIQAKAPQARTVRCTYGDIPMELLVGPKMQRDVVTSSISVETAKRLHRPFEALARRSPAHQHLFSSFEWTSVGAVDAVALKAKIAELPPSILRGKGFLNVMQAPEEQGIFQLVGKTATLVRGAPWRGPRSNRLVFVGTFNESEKTAALELLNGLLDGITQNGN